MSIQCIVVFGTASLQQYVFQSNRLKENIGASYLAKYWLKDGMIEAIRRADLTINTSCWDNYQQCIPGSAPSLSEALLDSAHVNLIYVGGGNAALLCKSRDIACQVVSAWSRELVVSAPGLRVVVGYSEVNSSFAEAYRVALDNLNLCEEALPFGSILYSLPVVRTCTTTGLPASLLSKEDEEWISQAAQTKRKQVGSKDRPGCAQTDISEEFGSVLEPKPKHDLPKQHFAIELEDLGGYEGQSHIAVVHADGNGMGDMLNEVIDERNQGDAEFLHHLRAFSTSVSLLSQDALQKTLKYLWEALPLEPLRNPEEVFPLRPIVYGGDDLTFVCDGRLGLDLASFYLKAFTEGKIRVLSECKPVNACAGVAIVPTKFPFARAYDFADKLCGLAKQHRRKKGGSNGSWLDFQIIQEGATRSITALRDIQYRSLEGQQLHQRPYEVPGAWNNFVSILNGFRSSAWPRSRAKALLHALTQGPTATEHFIKGSQWRHVELPSAGVTGGAKGTGWTGGDSSATTPYFDPLEVLDFWIEVRPDTENGDAGKENQE